MVHSALFKYTVLYSTLYNDQLYTVLYTSPSKCLNYHNQRLCKIFMAGVNLLIQIYGVL